MDEILIVDDSVVNQIVLTKMLEKDFKVFCAKSGKEMFTLLEQFEPKLILLDIVMPELDGFEIIVKLKASDEYNKIPVIFITGLNDESSEEKGFQLGAIDYITKPFKERVVSARVNSYVKLYDFIKMSEDLAQKDALTGLYNKKTTEELIIKFLSDKENAKCGALMIIDIDNFKSINDTFGHLYGDAVIKQLGSSLRNIFQKSDVLGRVGGDEFFVFLRNYNEHEILKQRAEQICNEFRKEYEQNGVIVKVSASVGIATTDNSFIFEDIYKMADIALYNTKARGKNDYSFFTGKEELKYQSARTAIESAKDSGGDLSESLKEFKENIKEHIFDVVEGTKVADYTIQSVLQLICNQFNFENGFVCKFEYSQGDIKRTFNWQNTNTAITPQSEKITLFEVSEMFAKFEHSNLIALEPTEHIIEFNINENKDACRYIFALKNKKSLMGYIGFEAKKGDEKLNVRVQDNVFDVCQQLSSIIINQFLLESVLSTKENMEITLNALNTPVQVCSPNFFKPLFINEAAKNSNVALHSSLCLKPNRETKKTCENCPMQNAAQNDGSFESDEYFCTSINWAQNPNAYIIEYKLPKAKK